jgi:hypothetical protein
VLTCRGYQTRVCRMADPVTLIRADRPARATHIGEYTRRSSLVNLSETDKGDTSRVRPAVPERLARRARRPPRRRRLAAGPDARRASRRPGRLRRPAPRSQRSRPLGRARPPLRSRRRRGQADQGKARPNQPPGAACSRASASSPLLAAAAAGRRISMPGRYRQRPLRCEDHAAVGSHAGTGRVPLMFTAQVFLLARDKGNGAVYHVRF